LIYGKASPQGSTAAAANTAAAPSAICSFSAESLDQLKAAGEAGIQALGDAWDGVTDTVQEWGDDLSALADDGLDALSSVADTLESATDAIGNGAKSAAAYLALGLHAAQSVLRELA